MKSKFILSNSARIIAILCAVLLHSSIAQANQPQTSPGRKQTPMAFNRLGSEIDKRYGSGAAGPVATAAGYKLTAKMQALEAEVTVAGLTVTSLAKNEGGGSFSIVPVALNGVKAGRGAASRAEGAVLLNRGVIAERVTASSDGIRQDFIVPMAPASNTSELVLTLAVSGATAA